MSNGQDSHGARGSQVSSAINPHPILIPGAVYTQAQILHNFRISKRTLARWEMAGLVPRRPASDEVYYLADDVIEVLKMPAEKIPKYLPKYKRKAN